MARNKKYKADKYKKQIQQKAAPVNVPTGSTQAAIQKRSGKSFFHDSWKTNSGIFLLLMIGTLILYSKDLHLGFFSVDDPGYITDDPWIKKITLQNLVHILTVPYFSNFSPAHLLSYMFDYTISGPDPFVFHLSSNIWAGIVAGFVFLTAHALLHNRMIAIAASILFVLHPVHVEAVAWISSRKDLIAAAFALPCFLAYLKYRNTNSKGWYISSLILFLFAIAGKLSVATFPAILFAYDLFVEKRPFGRSLIDKIPFLFIGIVFALAVASAQPPSGNPPDPFVYMSSLAQSLWLLTGFGSYVIYRIPPEPSSMGLEIFATIILLAVFFLPLFFRKKFPLTVVLIYWILLTYLPSQVLSFVHPVTDRYLFLPSAAFVILLAWGIIGIGKKFKRIGWIASSSVVLLITLLWGIGANNYLNEWNDPRSVWYGALQKSKDADVYYSFGANCLTLSGLLGTAPRGTPLSLEKKESLAEKVWKGDPSLPGLLNEWKKNQKGGPVEKEFQHHLWDIAEDAFKNALIRKGDRAMPHLYLRLGVLYLDKDNLDSAKKEFLNTIDELSRYTVEDVARELYVVCNNNLGVIAEKQSNYSDAVKYYKEAAEKQKQFGGNWIPGISSSINRMQAKLGIVPENTDSNGKTSDPDIAYNLGLYYLNTANRMSATPPLSIEESKKIASQVWKNNSQLPTLMNEWSTGQRGGIVEKSFILDLKVLAWNSFQEAVKLKGPGYINPHLYFRRGMILGDRGDLTGAKKEFLSAIDEASRDSNIVSQHEVTVTSHDALGILAWREKKYKEALQWFQTALREQNNFGGNWVGDLATKIKEMESMSSSH